MNNSTANTPILDDDAVSEIEARYQKATPGPWKVFSDARPDIVTTVKVNSGYMGERHLFSMDKYGDSWGQDFENEDDAEFIAHARSDIPALCATVRALRASMKTQKVELLRLSGRGKLLAKVHVNFDDLDPLEAVRNEFDRLRNIVIRDLGNQLKQVTKERDDARTENERLSSQLKQWQEEKDTKAGYM